MGVESQSEFVDICIQDPGETPESLIARINAALPSGVSVTAMRELLPHDFSLAEIVKGFEYEIGLPEESGEEELHRYEMEIRRFLDAQRFPVRRQMNGKTVTKEVRPFVAGLALDKSSRRIRLSAHFGPAGTVRPAELLTALFGFSHEAARAAPILKVATRPAHFIGPADREMFFGS